MNTRFREIRKATNLSQDAFGKRLGVSGPAVSRLESGVNAITDQMILSVCREYSVSENWLRNGSGGMFKYEDRDMPRLAEEFNLDEYGVRIITAYQKMPPEDREALIRFMREVVGIQTNADETAKKVFGQLHESQDDDESSFSG